MLTRRNLLKGLVSLPLAGLACPALPQHPAWGAPPTSQPSPVQTRVWRYDLFIQFTDGHVLEVRNAPLRVPNDERPIDALERLQRDLGLHQPNPTILLAMVSLHLPPMSQLS